VILTSSPAAAVPGGRKIPSRATCQLFAPFVKLIALACRGRSTGTFVGDVGLPGIPVRVPPLKFITSDAPAPALHLDPLVRVHQQTLHGISTAAGGVGVNFSSCTDSSIFNPLHHAR
jgi:hypothetical protein